MKKILLLILTGLSLINFSVAQTKVAVYVSGEVDASYKKVIGSKMVAKITKSGEFQAVERTEEFLASMAEEQAYQQGGAVDDEQIAELGKQFGVKYVVAAEVSNLLGEIYIAARMVNVETGLIKMSADMSRKVNGMSDLISLSEDLATKFIANGIKAVGPFKTSKELYDFKEQVPEGWRLAEKKELFEWIVGGKKLKYPVYTEIKCTQSEDMFGRDYVLTGIKIVDSEKYGEFKMQFRYNNGKLKTMGNAGYSSVTPISGYIYIVQE